MTIGEILPLVLGSSVLTVVITKLFERKQANANAKKLRTESSTLLLEGELRITEFYKQQLESIVAKYSALEGKLEEEMRGHQDCEIKIAKLESQILDLQRQITLLKSRVDNNK